MVQYRTVSYGSEVTEIGVVSDTHIPTRGRRLPPQIFNLFEGVQLILHAGDLVDEKVLDELRALAPLEAVAGNMDPVHLQSRLGRLKVVEVGSVKLGLLHGDVGGARFNYEQALGLFRPANLQVVVFGHLHRTVVEKRGDVLFFNPGSLVDPRHSPEATCGRLVIKNGEVSGEIISID